MQKINNICNAPNSLKNRLLLKKNRKLLAMIILKYLLVQPLRFLQNHTDFQGQFPVYDFERLNYGSLNNLKMVPDNITGVNPTSLPVIPDHR